MMLYQSMKMALKSILSSKVRAFLTMLGIIIGVSSVIALVSVGQGTTSQITESLSSLGTNQLTVNITGRGATTSLTYEEALALGEIEGAKNVSPVISGNVTAKHGTENVSVSVEGITPAYEDVQNFHVQSGRFLLDIDTEYRQKVALIGSDTAEDLFGTDSPVGEKVQLNGTSFKIVGLLESKGSTSGGSSDEKILIPISTAERFLQSRGVRSITITTTSMIMLRRSRANWSLLWMRNSARRRMPTRYLIPRKCWQRSMRRVPPYRSHWAELPASPCLSAASAL